MDPTWLNKDKNRLNIDTTAVHSTRLQTVNCEVCWTDRDRESNGDTEEDSGRISPLFGEEEFKDSCAKELALLALMEKTGYNIMQENGQRKYGGPPPGS